MPETVRLKSEDGACALHHMHTQHESFDHPLPVIYMWGHMRIKLAPAESELLLSLPVPLRSLIWPRSLFMMYSSSSSSSSQ